MDFLPPEIRTQIFVCLPVKTLVRCTCVCKKWKSYIEDPAFVEAHLQIQRRDLMLVRTLSKEDSSEETYALHCDDEAFGEYEKLNFPLTYPQRGGYFPIIGNCNGVLCITTDLDIIFHDTYMWNPTIRKMVKLPCPSVTYESHGSFEHELGFGYDAKTNDYKVIRIVQLDPENSIAALMVELYTLSSGIWRDISHLAPDIDCHLRRNELRRNEIPRNAYVNGAAHWVVRLNSSWCGGRIVSFHFGEEVFRCFDTPIENYRLSPVVVQESLCLVEEERNNRCIVWRMKVYGDSNSWTKWLDVKLPETIQRFIGFRKKGELLFQIDGKLSSFDHEKANGKDLNILKESDLRFWNLLQQGHVLPWYVREEVYTYDPNAAPKDLGIESKFEHFMQSLHCDSYVASLALIRNLPVEEKEKRFAMIKRNDAENLRKAALTLLESSGSLKSLGERIKTIADAMEKLNRVLLVLPEDDAARNGMERAHKLILMDCGAYEVESSKPTKGKGEAPLPTRTEGQG